MGEVPGPGSEELGIDPEKKRGDPTPDEIADACREILDEATLEEIRAIGDIEGALGLAFTALIEAGEDPEAFLIEQGVLQLEK